MIFHILALIIINHLSLIFRSSNVHHHGKFITGPPQMDASAMSSAAGDVSSKETQLPVVHLNDDDDHLVPYHLIVYRALNATICLFASVEDNQVGFDVHNLIFYLLQIIYCRGYLNRIN